MTAKLGLLALGACGLIAGCAAAPDYRWIKAGVDAKGYEADRVACLQTVDREFNPMYDYGPPGSSSSQEAIFRQDAAEKMFRDCMRGRGYRLVKIEPPHPQ
jgi:hypothetical protein